MVGLSEKLRERKTDIFLYVCKIRVKAAIVIISEKHLSRRHQRISSPVSLAIKENYDF